MDGVEGEERVLGYAGEQRGWCWAGVGAFAALAVSVLPFGVEWMSEWLRVWVPWERDWAVAVLFLGAALAVGLGFRAMVVLEKEEYAELRGRWMAAVGFYGGMVWVAVGIVRMWWEARP
jgi:hypothetical protein